MSGQTRGGSEPDRGEARDDRSADAADVGHGTEPPGAGGAKNAANPDDHGGHHGTRHSWTVSLAMVAAFLLAGAGMTFGPRDLLWVGVAGFVVLGGYSLAAHTWTDRGPRRRSENR